MTSEMLSSGMVSEERLGAALVARVALAARAEAAMEGMGAVARDEQQSRLRSLHFF
jgi:hypothetical protein